MKRRWEITNHGREIENPIARAAVAAFLMLGMVVLMIGMVLLFALMPLMILLHPLLRAMGLNGTMRTEFEDGREKSVLSLDRKAFRRRR